MGKINQLKPEVFNMIAAGEVVERPSSVVKELVENSIDAGASSVAVSIEEGGIRRIVVSDDGVGVQKDDMRLAFQPHATSKLKTIDDLDVMSTLGFRGEALASIASVSEADMLTCPLGGEAAEIALKGGAVVKECAASRAQGTTITVENLFFNTPARVKFLKKPMSEARIVEDTVRRLMLANPEIAISLSIDGETVLQQQSGTLEDSLYSVYDTKTAQKLMFFDDDIGSIRVYGFTSMLDFTKPNRTYQTVIINGRSVESQLISTAVEKAYSGYLMKRTYPMFVLNMLIPFDELDVNVHPSKTEVRFSNSQQVFSAVFHAVSNAINAYVKQNQFGFDPLSGVSNGVASGASGGDSSGVYGEQMRLDTSRLFSGAPSNQGSQHSKADYVPNPSIYGFGSVSNPNGGSNGSNNSSNDAKSADFGVDFSAEYRNTDSFGKVAETQIDDYSDRVSSRQDANNYSQNASGENAQNNGNRSNNCDFFNPLSVPQKPDYSERLDAIYSHQSPSSADFSRQDVGSVVPDLQNADSTLLHSYAQGAIGAVFDGKIVGQIFDTYILVERDERLYVIDQHAAHERILFDKLMQGLERDKLQYMLVPLKIHVDGAEAEYLERIYPRLNDLGFDIEQTKPTTFIFYAVPVLLVDMDVKKFLSKLFEDMLSEGDLSVDNLVRDKICQQACKAAIKGGSTYSLTREQIEQVLSAFIDKDGFLPSKCPHGRPAVVAVTKNDMEKLFKRIV